MPKLFLTIAACFCISYTSGLKTNGERFLRIVGGKDCITENYPFIASIHFPKSNQTHRCGGTLISSRYVLTAAHCLSQNLSLSDYLVVVGISDMTNIYNLLLRNGTKIPKNSFGQKSGIDSFTIHHGYSASKHINDIALLHLIENVIPSSTVGFAHLPPQKYHQEPAGIYKRCLVAGWGVQVPMSLSMQRINSTNPHYHTTMLQCASLPLIFNKDCISYLKNFLDIFELEYDIYPEQLCTLFIEGGKDSCYGDSGGPLICDNTVVGIISSGWGCALPNTPALLTRVDYFLDWIHENTEKKIIYKSYTKLSASATSRLLYSNIVIISCFTWLLIHNKKIVN